MPDQSHRHAQFQLPQVPTDSARILDYLRQLNIFLMLKLQQIDEHDPLQFSGTGSPETVVSAPVGSIYQRLDGGANTTLYVKESGTAKVGWVAK